MSDLMREEFESEFKIMCESIGCIARLQRHGNGDYEYIDASSAWWAWQKSRKSLVVSLPPSECYAGYDNDFMMISEDVREAMREAGVNTK